MAVQRTEREIIKTIGKAIRAHDVTVLVKAGANRETLLQLLAMAVIEPEGKPLADGIRAKQKQLRSVALQVRTVIRHAERLATESDSYLEFYSPFDNQDFKRYKDIETRKLASRWPFQAMRDYADWAEKEAHSFGRLLRRNSQKERNLGILWLLSWVHLRTTKLFTPELARLLSDASVAVGKPRELTASGLQKMFERNVLRSQRESRLDT